MFVSYYLSVVHIWILNIRETSLNFEYINYFTLQIQINAQRINAGNGAWNIEKTNFCYWYTVSISVNDATCIHFSLAN